jgi:hypothetical protein
MGKKNEKMSRTKRKKTRKDLSLITGIWSLTSFAIVWCVENPITDQE